MAKGLYKRGGVWWLRYSDGFGKIVRESAKTSNYKDAQITLEDRRREIRKGVNPEPIKKIPNHTFMQLATDYKQWCERQRGYRAKRSVILQLIDTFGNIPLRQFNTRQLEQFQTDRLNKGNKPATVNRLIATLKHCINKGCQWEMLSEETLKRVRQVKLLEENNKRLRYLSSEEAHTLVNASNGNTKAIVITALNTGCRKGEVLSLKWDNVDLKHGFILLDKTKNGDRREIPINDTLRGVLQGITRRLDVPYVFYDAVTGKPYGDIKRSFHTAMKNVEYLKCPDCNYQKTRVKSKEDAGNCPSCGVRLAVHKGIQDFHFHDLRHTFASHLVMGGVDITTVSRLLGHKSLSMTLRYAHLAPAHLVSAVNVLDGALNPTAHLLHKKEAASLG